MKIKLILFAIALIISGTAFKCDKNSADWAKVPNGAVQLSRKKMQTTAGGARVFSEKGVSQSFLNTVEQGLTERAAIAAKDGHKLYLNADAYEIYVPVVPCQMSPIQRVWSFLVRGDNYDGTEYDQYNPKGRGVADGIGVVFAAEMISDLNGKMVACAEGGSDAIGNGVDHIVLYNNPDTYPDGLNYFYCTWTHDRFSHPLLPRDGRCEANKINQSAIPSALEMPLENKNFGANGLLIGAVK